MVAEKMLLILTLLGQGYDVNDKNINLEDIHCLAKNLYHESRAEPDMGQIAVAHVTLNRVKSKHYPSTICDVVYEKGKRLDGTYTSKSCQFSWVCDHIPNDISFEDETGKPIVSNITYFEKCIKIAYTVLYKKAKDPTSGSLHYYNPSIVEEPKWANGMYSLRIGNHLFLPKVNKGY